MASSVADAVLLGQLSADPTGAQAEMLHQTIRPLHLFAGAPGDIVRCLNTRLTAREAQPMCNLFASQDPATYAAETRSVRLHGHVTSIRLEAAFWTTLKQIAGKEGMSVGRFVSVLHDEILDRNGDVANFASFLRVACLHWLRNQDLHDAQLAARRAAVAAPVAAENVAATA